MRGSKWDDSWREDRVTCDVAGELFLEALRHLLEIGLSILSYLSSGFEVFELTNSDIVLERQWRNVSDGSGGEYLSDCIRELESNGFAVCEYAGVVI